MSALKSLILPAVTGLIVAIVIITLLPNKENKTGVVLIEAPAERTATASKGKAPQSYADAVALAQPAVVNIYTSKIVTRQYHPLYDDPIFRRFFGMNNVPRRQRMQSSLGSGVIVSPSGYVLTNNHVIAGADEIKVALEDGREALASVVGTDPETDLAILYIEVPDLPAVTLARRSDTRVGDIVLAIGNPFG
ncbi:MAG: trypsin-like peptidase domain-containing protein, partial [Pseudomonadales bacterium]|nr:trypsin-like peptidase domain-containing protein [Pseudomonadales bacterium]